MFILFMCVWCIVKICCGNMIGVVLWNSSENGMCSVLGCVCFSGCVLISMKFICMFCRFMVNVLFM